MTPATQRTPLLGLDFDTVTEQQAIEHVVGSLEAGGGGWLCPVNLDVLRQCAESPELEELVRGADLLVGDGMPLIWLTRLAGSPLPERVAGSSLIYTLSAAAAKAGRSVFMLGGNPGTAEKTAENLVEQNPDLGVAGTICPPMGFHEDSREKDRISTTLQRAAPDIVFVGLGFPKQDRLAIELRAAHPRSWFVSCGVGFSFVSGELRRAPRWVQESGLEWAHRLIQEPRRLVRRYLVDDAPFLARTIPDVVQQRRNPGARRWPRRTPGRRDARGS
jgi:N-acetylglucosaminyldiphosphoundecaprenol N-acetyl-beta-D-mannosaminyltransferase